MTWDEVWKIVLGILASMGGISGFVLLAIRLSANMIAERLSKKYDLKLSKDLERYKLNLENKTYISKTKFDAEFELYRNLSKACSNMVKETSQLFPTSTKDGRDDFETYKAFHDKAVDAIIIAQDELGASAPFISEEVFNGFSEIEKLCKIQLSDFQDFRLRPDAKDYRAECKDAFNKTYPRTKEIAKKYEELMKNLRTYLSQLDVID